MVTDLNAKWIYSLGPKRPAGVPAGVDWVPMIHNDKPTSPALQALDLVKAEQTYRPTALLGFNLKTAVGKRLNSH